MAPLMLVLGLVLSLAACGGSGTDGLSKAEEDDLEARVEAAEADKVAAEADKVAAEADKAAAEADKVAAEEDKAAAEMAKVAAEADKAIAEADKAIAEAERDQAEAAKVAAEADKAIAEADKAAAEADKVAAEADKAAAEMAKVAAEADKAIAEAAKAIAEAERDQAEAAKVAAEAAKVAAEAAKVTAEAAKVTAEAAKVIAVADAERARRDLADARRDLADARRDLATARRDLATARLQAETAQQAQERLAAEAEEVRQQAQQAEAGVALRGLGGTRLELPMDSVGPKYRAPASVSAPNVTFISPRGSSAGKWYATTASNQGQITDDTIVVYSDVGAPDSTPIMEVYNGFAEDADNTNLLAITISNAHNNLIASSRFPTAGRTATIPLTIDSDDDDADDQTAKLSGRFDGASGTFQCSGGACTVRHTGGGYVLDGDWTFRTSKNSKVKVPDGEFMYFGWWRQKTNTTGATAFAYGTFSKVGSAVSGGGFATLQGSATYEGRAIGQYAIYQPLGTQSNHGEFRATARFTANFDTDMLSGSVSGFNVSPGWSLTLKETSMSNGTVAEGDVSWTIDGNIQDGGNWNGAFHSEIDPYVDHIPDGLTGTFGAEYADVGELVGAFGTHKK